MNMNQILPNNQRPFELGLYTFIDNGTDLITGETKAPALVMENTLETIELADQTGLDVIAIGEHHREEYLSSAPVVILAAAASRTKNIRLSTAVTVLSSDDPVRVFQSFSTLDLLSKGRAEIMAGRGSFIESFPLFGYDLNDYAGLFEEKLRLLAQLTDAETINFTGKFRSSLKNQVIYPRPIQDRIPVWVAVGGSPESAKRAASLGLPMAFAIIGGVAERFATFFDIYRITLEESGFDPDRVPASVNSHGFIAENSQDAVEEFYPYSTVMMKKIGKERGWGPTSREQLEKQRLLEGSDFVGSPQQIIEKILYQHEIFGQQRFLMYMGNNAIEHKKMMKAIELFGTKVAPEVRKEIARRNSA
jgi:probable LLM family oxidoreductase